MGRELILIVDDDPVNAEMLQAFLDEDYRTKVANNGSDALSLAFSTPHPDLILLDVVMPGMNGYRVCAELKRNPATRKIPVIFVTARSEEQDEARGLELGAVDYISKPCPMLVVQARVKTHLEQKRIREELELSKEKYRNLIDNAVDVIYTLDPGGRLIEVNKAFLAAGDYQWLDLANMGIDQLAHPDDVKSVRKALRQVHPEQRSWDFEARLKKRNGDYSWYSAVHRPLFGPEGALSAIHGIARNIDKRKRAEEELSNKERYFRGILATVQAGVIVTDEENGRIIDANPSAAKMLACGKENLVGRRWHELCAEVAVESECLDPTHSRCEGIDTVLKRQCCGEIHVRQSSGFTTIGDRAYRVASFLDISDIKDLIKRQNLNISQAKKIQQLINGVCARHIELPGDLSIFIDAVSVPCNTEGGDHFFVRRLQGNHGRNGTRTVMSLKDQSGHEVGCILRSIAADAIHQAAFTHHPEASLQNIMTLLNEWICSSGIYRSDDFFTSVTAEIDHDSLTLRYVSAGHPSFILIRGEEILLLPDADGAGANMAMAMVGNARFTAGEIPLKPGDKMIFYTDGLMEIPLEREERLLTAEDLKDIVQNILQSSPDASVMDIVYEVLDMVAEFDSSRDLSFPKEKIGDDVTLLGVELEDQSSWLEESFYPGDSHGLSNTVDMLVERLRSAWAHRRHFPDRELLNLIIEEAVLNAWKHGNRCSPEKRIVFRHRCGNDLHMEVIDEGDGFDASRLSDPTKKENLKKQFGRGVFIMRRLCDDVTWKNGGSHVGILLSRRPKAWKDSQPKSPHHMKGLWEETIR